MMKRILTILFLTSITAFAQTTMKYDNFTHAINKPSVSAGSIYDYDFTGLSIHGLAVGGTPGGGNTQVQYNNAGAFGGTPFITVGGASLNIAADLTNYTQSGDTTKKFHFDGSGITPGQNRGVVVADANSVTVVPVAVTSNNFLTGISGAGVVSKAQPSAANLSNGTTGTGLVVLDNAPALSSSLAFAGNYSLGDWGTIGARIKQFSATITDLTSSGTVSVGYSNAFNAGTIAATSATTFTDYYNIYGNDPTTGSNVTMTNKWGIGADSAKFGTSNQFSVGNGGHVTEEGVTSTGATGTGKLVFDTSPTINGSLTLNTGLSSPAWTTAGIRFKELGATFTDTTSTGTVAAGYTNFFSQDTVAASNATTFTDYYTQFSKDPGTGTNVTFTNRWAVGGDSAKFGTSNQFTVGNTGHVTMEGVTSTGATGTGKDVFDNTPTIISPVISTGLTASGSSANNFSGSTGTFLTSTGANTLGGNTTINGTEIITPAARSSGTANYWTLNTPTDTGITAATESIGFNHATATRTWATTGTVGLQRENYFAGPTYASASASQTFTDACTVYIDKPINGTNAIFTRSHSLAIVDSTTSNASTTGALVVATALGTGASSVGIGSGNIVAGNQLKAPTIQATTGFSGTTSTGIFNFNQAKQSQLTVSATEYYLTRSDLDMPAAYTTAIGAGTTMKWRISLTKDANGTGTFQILIKKGTNGTTADAALVTQTIGTQTAAADNMECDITLTWTSTTGAYWSMVPHQSAASGVGFGLVYPAVAAQFTGTVSGQTTTTASDKYGLSVIFTTGTPTFTVPMVQAQAFGVN